MKLPDKVYDVLKWIVLIALPALTGLIFGVKALLAFLIGAVLFGFILINTFNCSGRHFENAPAIALSTLIKMMVVFSAVFLYVFINIGGLIY